MSVNSSADTWQLVWKSWLSRVAIGAAFYMSICVGGSAQQTASTNTTHPEMAIGAAAPDFDLPGIDGRNHKLAEYAGAKVLAIVFESNHSPASQMYEARIKKLYDDYRTRGIAVVAINPDNPNSVSYAEQGYADASETLDDMKEHASFGHIDWPYLFDGDKQLVSSKFGPSSTPEIFIFDQARKLQYRGRIDDNLNEAAVKSYDARNAIDALLSGQSVSVPITASFGSPVDWSSQIPAVKAELAKIEAEPVELSMATKEALGKLRSNPTGKMLLINFWATWCGPCVGEFPDLQDTFRMFRARGLAFVTVSENTPDEKTSVMEFLKNEHATGQNMLFAEDDVYAMQAAFDPNMAGAVPVTVLMASNGDVLYEQVGDLDTLKLRRAILANLPDTKDYPGDQAYWSSSGSSEN
jgi:peroxiredoxin